MEKFGKPCSIGSIPVERMRSIRREATPKRFIMPEVQRQQEAIRQITVIRGHLETLQEGLRSGPARQEFRKADGAAMTEFGRLFTKFSDEVMPGSVNSQAEYLYRSDDTIRRWRRGRSIPSQDELSRVFGKVEKITGSPVPAERCAELLEAHKEASEVPRTLRRRLEAVQAELAETIKRDADLADRVNELQEEIASLERQLMALQGSGGSDYQDMQSGKDPDTQQEQELRRRLVQANQDLDEALKQQRENHQELRECARKLVEAVDSYLSFTF